jgi:hypothetical protein
MRLTILCTRILIPIPVLKEVTDDLLDGTRENGDDGGLLGAGGADEGGVVGAGVGLDRGREAEAERAGAASERNEVRLLLAVGGEEGGGRGRTVAAQTEY